MKHATSFFLLFALSFFLAGFANSVEKLACTRFPEVAMAQRSMLCDCDDSLESKYSLSDGDNNRLVDAPRAMHLVAVCDYRWDKIDGPHGLFFFRGNVVTSGSVKRFEEGVIGLGELFEFSSPEFRGVHLSEDGAKSKLGLPEISDMNPCWSVSATLIITEYSESFGYGGDADGSYISGVDVVRHGDYARCVL